MRYLLPCKCGQSVEVEPGQAGQTVVCTCGENLAVPSMLQVKALPVAPEKPVQARKKISVPYRTALVTFILGIVCLVLFIFLRSFESGFFFSVIIRGLMGAFICASIAYAFRDWAKSQSAEDSTLRRLFFVLGVALLFPALSLASYLYEWKPEPRHVSAKRTFFSYGTNKKPLYQDSTPIAEAEHRILWMTDEGIDHMSPMDLYFYFRTLEQPTFSYNFQDNYEAVKDTYRIWVIGNLILCILSFLSIVVSFFMPRQTVIVSGWSGSEWR